MKNNYHLPVHIVCLIFLLSFACHGDAEVMVKNSKIVKIDDTWHIFASYKQEINLKDDADITKYKVIHLPKSIPFRIIRHAKALAEMDSGKEIFATRNKNQLIFTGVNAPAVLMVEFTIETHYQDMDGLFVDVFDSSEALESYYKVIFPESGDYQWIIQRGGVPEVVRSSYGSVFEWDYSGDAGPATVRVSTVKRWDDIQAHYVGIYEKVLKKGLVFDMRTKIDQWQQDKNDIALIRVFEYIRQHIHYQPHLEKGAPFTPAQPDDVLKRGWGDCKDLSTLAVKLLRLLGVEAYPVLCAPGDKVNLRWPDPFVFNHAIVKIIVDEEAQYYDLSRGKKRLPQMALEKLYLLPLTLQDI